jgi:hypothetical protein
MDPLSHLLIVATIGSKIALQLTMLILSDVSRVTNKLSIEILSHTVIAFSGLALCCIFIALSRRSSSTAFLSYIFGYVIIT